MTGSRDIEGMVVFSVGRVVNAWLIDEAIFAFRRAYPFLLGATYSWWDDHIILAVVNNA